MTGGERMNRARLARARLADEQLQPDIQYAV